MARCFLILMYWYCGSIGLFFATYARTRYFDFVETKTILNFWSVMREPQFYTYAFTGASFSGLFTYVAALLFFLWMFLKLMPQRTDGFCLYVFEFY
jgi:hypothetical protein